MTFISASKPFAHLDRLAQWQAGDRPSPVTVEIDLTNVCSRGCQSCHFAHTHVAGPLASRTPVKPHGYQETGRVFDTELLLRVLPQMRAAGVRGLVFSGGGEPTLHPNFDEIVGAAAACGFQIGMYTVGGHLSPARAALVSRLMQWVVVSLDAYDADTYAREKGVPTSFFDEACAGAARVASHQGAVVGISFLLHRENWQRVWDMRSLAQSLGATYTTFRPTIETDASDLSTITGDRSWVTDALPVLQRLSERPDVEADPSRFVEYRDWSGRSYPTCFGVRLVTQITPDGRVWICPNRRGIAGSQLGDLHAESFASIWSRHPGQWTDFSGCRAMCRLHLVNETLAPVFTPQQHEAFV